MSEGCKIHSITRGILPVTFHQVLGRDFCSVADLRQLLHRLEDARHTFGKDSNYFEMLNQSSTKTSIMKKQMELNKEMMSKFTTVVSGNALQSSSKPPTPPHSRRPFV
ncbi:unnamed protein product [Orchesella dallaii]|uniref:Uncharacterized protein n=1 Tax=Orchesella dallaii TaxID=48710 RepID=A0ABP1S7T7_9HEXA